MRVLLAAHEDRLASLTGLVLVEVLDELADAALVVELVALAFLALVVQRDRDPPFRNASSRRRLASMSKLNSVVSKICGSGLNVTFVPRRFVVPVMTRSLSGLPRS